MTLQLMRIVRTVFWLFSATAAVCLWAEETFIPDQKGCKVANPSPKPNESVQWSGECVDGYAEGKGLLQWYVDGTVSTRYEGTLQHGLLSGEGKLVMPNGASYEGHWLAGKQEGQGVQVMPDGSRYEGQWKNGQPHGHGMFRNAAGETTEGEWEDGSYVGEEAKDN
jgi:hypothetical protein